MSVCQEQCSSYGWCIGFSYRNFSYCSLFQRRAVSCPPGYSLSSGNVATAINQLKASTTSGYNCMGKVSTGNNIVHLIYASFQTLQIFLPVYIRCIKYHLIPICQHFMFDCHHQAFERPRYVPAQVPTF